MTFCCKMALSDLSWMFKFVTNCWMKTSSYAMYASFSVSFSISSEWSCLINEMNLLTGQWEWHNSALCFLFALLSSFVSLCVCLDRIIFYLAVSLCSTLLVLSSLKEIRLKPVSPPTEELEFMFRIFNNYSSSPNGPWVNSPWGRRPSGLLTQRLWGREE